MQTCSLLDFSAALQPNLCKRSALLIIIDYQSSSSSHAPREIFSAYLYQKLKVQYFHKIQNKLKNITELWPTHYLKLK